MIPTAASAGDVWQQVTGTQPAPPAGVVLGAGLVAAVLVGWRPSWRLVRGVVTIAHEAGHAAVAALTGRTLMVITLHSDTSGLTVSRGRPTGPGMVATLAAGYVAPSVLGVAAVGLLVAERTTLLLWGTIVLLAAVLALIRNVYGALSVVSTGAVVGMLSWYGSPAQQGAFAYFVAWFLLLSAPRPVLELTRARRGRARDSDPDQLARLTAVPARAWVAVFGVVTLALAALGAWWLLPWEALGDAVPEVGAAP